MLSAQLGSWERSLTAHLAKLANKRLGQTVALIEVIDAAAPWSDALVDLSPAFSGLDFSALMEQFPVLGCAAATEVGFRFEGVGTVFWARFEELLDGPIPPGERHKVAQAFTQLADRFALQRPSQSAFSEQFSIIAWPIANALMPYDLAGPVARLLSRAPAAAVAAATSGRRPELSRLRAWAQAWEGARLTDWLHADGPAPRVIAALLSDNAKAALRPATFQRLTGAFQQAENRFALRAARRRKIAASPVSLEGAADLGHLSLRRIGGEMVISATWPPLSPALAEQGRREASALGWRPKLFGQSRTASDNVFGTLPIVLRLETFPAVTDLALPDVVERFGVDSPVAAALQARRVDWDAPLVFLVTGDEAEQTPTPLPTRSGMIWVLDRQNALPAQPHIGRVAGAAVRSLDLAVPADRAVAETHGWLAQGGKVTHGSTVQTLARRPADALALPRRHVAPQSAYCLFDEDTVTVLRLRRRETVVDGLTVLAVPEDEPAAPGVFLFERESAFDALVEQRLVARLQSAIPGARWPVEVMIRLDDEILAYGAESLADDGRGLPPGGRILQALQSDAVRDRLLRAGRGTLCIRIGRHPWETVALKRHDGDVDWTQDDPAASLAQSAKPVTSAAPLPYRFKPDGHQSGVLLRAFQFGDGRLAEPACVTAPSSFGMGDLSADFGLVEGRRRLRGEDGVLDLARARRGWATAHVDTLAGLMARIGVVRQFEAPLVAALCGPQWRTLEASTPRSATPGEILFERIRPDAIGDQIEGLSEADLQVFAALFAKAINLTCPDWTEDGAVDDACADQALLDAYAVLVADAQAEGRLMDLDPDEPDFGASGEQWRAAAASSLATAEHTPVVALIAPTAGAKVLARRRFTDLSLAEASAFLVDWTGQWCLPRGQLDLDGACGALQFWLAPHAADPEAGALLAMSRDVFMARAVRFVATRMIAP